MRAPQHIVASYAVNAWHVSRGGRALQPAFKTPQSWQQSTRSRLLQVARGCSLIADWQSRFDPPEDLGVWTVDAAELRPVVMERIRGFVGVDPPEPNKRGLRCGWDLECGTYSAYAKRGGRCEACRAAAASQRSRYRSRFVCGTDSKCGTYKGYQRGGRCEACRAAWTLRQKDWRVEWRARFRCGADRRCGYPKGYAAGGRCDKCKAAHTRKFMRDYHLRKERQRLESLRR